MRYPEETRRRAAELRLAGKEREEIARELGVSETTLRRWLDPAYAERDRATAARWKQQQRGRCAGCGAETRYAGKPGRPTSALCRRCAALQNARGIAGTLRPVDDPVVVDPGPLTLVRLLPGLLALTDAQREVWVDRHVVGLSNLEIAERRGVSRETVRVLLTRASERIRAALAADEEAA